MNIAPRRVALETLLDVSRSDAYASLALDKRLAQANLPRRVKIIVNDMTAKRAMPKKNALDYKVMQFQGEVRSSLRRKKIWKSSAW